MRKIIYNTIVSALNNIEAIKHVGLWNNQLQYIEEEQPFNTPAVLMEFDTIQWRKQLHGVREAEITVRLHVITDSRVGAWADVIGVFDLLDTINATLHGLHHVETNGSVMDAITLTSSTTDHNFDELQDDIETYTCHVTDMSGYSR